jgi:hypothetical protein
VVTPNGPERAVARAADPFPDLMAAAVKREDLNGGAVGLQPMAQLFSVACQ